MPLYCVCRAFWHHPRHPTQETHWRTRPSDAHNIACRGSRYGLNDDSLRVNKCEHSVSPSINESVAHSMDYSWMNSHRLMGAL